MILLDSFQLRIFWCDSSQHIWIFQIPWCDFCCWIYSGTPTPWIHFLTLKTLTQFQFDLCGVFLKNFGFKHWRMWPWLILPRALPGDPWDIRNLQMPGWKSGISHFAFADPQGILRLSFHFSNAFKNRPCGKRGSICGGKLWERWQRPGRGDQGSPAGSLS